MAKGIGKNIWTTFVLFLFIGILPLNVVTAVVIDPSGSGSGPVLETKERYVAGEVLVKLSPSTASVRAVKKSKQGLAIESLRGYGEHSVQPLGRIKPKKSASKARSVLKEPAINRWYLVKLPSGMSVDEALAILKQDSGVEVAEPNYEVSIAATPNDPRYPELWNMHNIAQTGGTPNADIDGPEAWDIATGNGDVIIGVIDTGVDYTHEDLKDNMWTNPGEIPGNGIDDDGNGYVDDVYGYDFINNDGDPMDDHGHGTHVAGTIAGVGDNNIGVVGVNWNAKIAGIKFLSANGRGSTVGAINSMVYANNNGISITNNSWGGGPFSQALLDAINAGGLFVAAAGNASNNTDNVSFYPAAYISDNIISVAATDHNDALASFSNYGLASVDLAAPGVSILSTVPYSSCFLCDTSGYRWLSGTSMAAPHVAGAAALMQSIIPQSTTAQLKTWIMDSVDPVAALNGRMVTGGRLNINTLLSSSDYGLTLDPGTVSFRVGQSATATLMITALDTFNGPLLLQVDNSNPALTVTLSKTTVDIQPGDVDVVTVTVSADVSIPAGSYTYRLLAIDAANIEKSLEVTVDVRETDYNVLITPDSLTVEGSQSATYVVALESIAQFTGPVTLSFNVDDTTIVGTLSENSVMLSADGITTVNLSVSTTVLTQNGIHELQVNVSDGVRSKTASAQLNVIQKPDLIVSALSNPGVIGLQGVFSVDFTVTNQGLVSAGRRISYQIVLSDDAVITSSDTILESSFFSGPYYYSTALAANSSKSFTRTFTLPDGIAEGDHYLGVIIDYDNLNAESDETNNTRSQPIQVITSAQDAVINNLTSDRSSLFKGTTVQLTAALSNSGTNAMTGLGVNYYLSTDNVITADDYLVGSGSIDLGADSSGSLSVTSPTIYLATGDYYFGVIVDPDNMFAEIDEDNNLMVSQTVITILDNADLVVSALSGPDVVGLQGVFQVNFTATNQGPVSVGRNVFYQIVLSDDAIITSSDTILESSFFSGPYYYSTALAANSSKSFTRTFTLPDGIVEGDYYLGVILDYNDLNAESDETNNTRSQPTQVITSAQDAAISSLTSDRSLLFKGTTVQLTAALSNNGTNAMTGLGVNYYLSTDNIITADDYLVGSNSIDLGADSSGSLSVTSPAIYLATGDYYFGVIVDPDNMFAETDESNNLVVSSTVIAVLDNADLVVSALSGPDVVGLQGIFQVDFTVTNQGPVSVGRNVFYQIVLSDDAVITSSDIILESSFFSGPYYYSTALAANSSKSFTRTFTLPDGIAEGDYYLGVILDYNDLNAESDESNNTRSQPTLVITSAQDAVINNLTSDKSLLFKGTTVQLTAALSNNGTNAMTGLDANYYLSTDNVITADDYLVGSGSIDLGADSSGSFSVTSPAIYLATGDYYFGVIVDPDNMFAEIDEDNNLMVSSTVIAVLDNADLVVSALSGPGVVGLQGVFQVNFTATNQGPVSVGRNVSYQIVLSDDAVITSSDTILESSFFSGPYYYSTALAANSSKSFTRTLTLPDGIVEGDYYLGVILDYNELNAESDETNNTRSSAVTVQ